MRIHSLFLLALPAALGACHSGGAYFSENPAKPRGPGVVDCGWFWRDDPANTYVVEYEAPSSAAEMSYYGSRFRTAGATSAGAPVVTPVVTTTRIAEPVAVVGRPEYVREDVKGTIGASVTAPRLPPPPAPRAAVIGLPKPTTTVRTTPPAPRTYTAGPNVVQGKVVTVPKAATLEIDADEVTLPPPRPGAPLMR